MAFDFFKKIIRKLDQVVTGRGKIDEDLFEEFEESLLQGDVNVHTATRLLKNLRESVQDERMKSSDEVVVKAIKAGSLMALRKRTMGIRASKATGSNTSRQNTINAP